MPSIYRITDKEIFIDTLIIQPSFYCEKGCADCYIHSVSRPKIKHIAPFQLEIVANKFICGDDYKTNQLSISIDELPSNLTHRAHMAMFLDGFFCFARANKNKNSPELHTTMYSPKTILSYEAAGLNKEDFLLFDSIYFSHILQKDMDIIKWIRKSNPKIEIGWNNLFRVSNFACSEVVDNIYWLVDKVKSNPIICGFNGVRDVCWRDYQNWKQDWHNTTCSANVSKFTIWPDGSVTGCPYKIGGKKSAKNSQEVLLNIIEASKEYDFNDCCLKEIYK
jgi:hypothetical protein